MLEAAERVSNLDASVATLYNDVKSKLATTHADNVKRRADGMTKDLTARLALEIRLLKTAGRLLELRARTSERAAAVGAAFVTGSPRTRQFPKLRRAR